MSNYEANVKVNITGIGDLNKLEQRFGELKNVPIKLNVENGNAKSSIDSIVKSVANTKIKLNVDSDAIKKLKSALELKGVSSSVIEKTTDRLNNLGVKIKSIKESTSGNLLSELKISGIDELGRAVTVIDSFDKKTGKLKASTTNVTTAFNDIAKEAEVSAKKVSDIQSKFTNGDFLSKNSMHKSTLSKYSNSNSSYLDQAKNSASLSLHDLSLLINKTTGGIRGKAFNLGLKKDRYPIYDDFSEFIRGKNCKWKRDSCINSNYKCAISSERFTDIHHLYGMNMIIQETLISLNLNSKVSYKELTELEIHNILVTFFKIQSKYPLGICLSKHIHTQFHKECGFGNNTPEQFYEFCRMHNYKINTK